MAAVDFIHLTLSDCKEVASRTVLTPLTDHFSAVDTCLVNMQNNHTLMLMTINRCLDYTKASTGLPLVSKLETVDLCKAIFAPLSCMQHLQGNVQLRLGPLADSICAQVITDKQWLEENLLCLLSNAVKYSSGGCVNVTISLDHSPSQKCRHVSDNQNWEDPCLHHYLRFEVEDAGIGMDDDTMATMFDPVEQRQRLVGGAGLGLYCLGKRLEALSGDYGVMHRRDGLQGSLFWMSIPYRPVQNSLVVDFRGMNLQQSDQHDLAEGLTALTNSNTHSLLSHPVSASSSSNPSVPAKSTTTENDQQASTASSPPLTVLVVDDSPSILKMSSLMLKRLGHEVFTASNGAVAVDMVCERFDLHQVCFDVILMDLQMPIMDGLEATKRIRELEVSARNRKTPGSLFRPWIIACMSANSDYESTNDSLEAGADVFLPKPFGIDILFTTLQSLVQADRVVAIS
jgi:CheY-like chemotaxis protein